MNALGLDLESDVDLFTLIPDEKWIPDFAAWDKPIIAGENPADAPAASSQQQLRTGRVAPGHAIYQERLTELSHSNEDAFRSIRRQTPAKGRTNARLGNSYEFFRCLELFTEYWDDPTRPPSPALSPELLPSETLASAPASDGDVTMSETPMPAKLPVKPAAASQPNSGVRIAAGRSMPPEFRNNLIAALVKLVAYDFGCNVAHSRVEPRLQMSSPKKAEHRRKSYIPCHFQFVFQSPQSREAARLGTVTGPIAAISSRQTVDFTTPDVETAQSLDLAREILAALITAQHRARQGKTEVRFGEGKWWATKPRWGGGSGGPIGKEDNDDMPNSPPTKRDEDEEMSPPRAKKSRKTLSMYDTYRMVRPASHAWDRRANYELIGKQYGTNYDDIFLVSSLFHHVSFLRVRVPIRLLEVLEGSPEPDASWRSWGKLSAYRSRWFDLFETEGRIEAMKHVFAIMEYQMRHDTGDVAFTGGAV